MKRNTALIFGLLLTLPSAAMAGQICITNSSEEPYLFAAEAHGGMRETAMLAPNETLCVAGGETGVVSVFEHADVLEGCSRLVTAGQGESLTKYVDFDRCFWASNSG